MSETTTVQPSRVNVRQNTDGYRATVAYRDENNAKQYLEAIGRAGEAATLSVRAGMASVDFPFIPGFPAAHYLNPMHLTDAVAAHVVPMVNKAVAVTNAIAIGLNQVSNTQPASLADSFVAEAKSALGANRQL